MDTGGEHDDRQLARPFVGAQLLGQRHTGLARQHPIKNQQVRQGGANSRFGLLGATGANYEKTGVLEVDDDQFLDRRLVLNDQNSRCHLMPSLPV